MVGYQALKGGGSYVNAFLSEHLRPIPPVAFPFLEKLQICSEMNHTHFIAAIFKPVGPSVGY